MSLSQQKKLEHERQMAAIHDARSALRSLSREERDAHAALARSHEREARWLLEHEAPEPQPDPVVPSL